MVQPTMLSSSSQRHNECDAPDVAAVDEMEGWASVAEALLHDCARVTIIDVAEPSARQALEAEHTASLARVVHEHLSALSALHQREVAHESRLHDDVLRELDTLTQECDSLAEQLVAERTARAALEEETSATTAELQAVETEREALQAERAAVWQMLRAALMSAPPHRRSAVSPANATLEDHVRHLCARLKDAEDEVERLHAAAAEPPAVQLDEAPQSVFTSPRAAYRRILPAAPLNPVTASLLRVKEQVQQLREPSVTQLQQAVGAYRPLREESMAAAAAAATTPPARTRAAQTPMSATTATSTGVTPPPVDRSLGLSRSYTPLRSTASVVRSGDGAGGAASPPWRTHMAKLQAELKGLRRDLGTASPH